MMNNSIEKSILTKWIEVWDSKIEAWHNNPVASFEKSLECKYYNGSKKAMLDINALPEPYLGNPFCNSAVILNMNPGSVLKEFQDISTGKFITDDKAHLSYSAFSLPFPYLNKYSDNGGGSFWKKRKRWIAQFQNYLGVETPNQPFAIELFPWHSSKFGSLNKDESYLQNIDNEVLNIAENALTYSDLPFVLSISKQYVKIFEMLGFEKLIEMSPDYNHGIVWPINSKGNKTNRYYSLWKSPRGKLHLNTWSVGSNIQPSKCWATVEKYIISTINIT